MLQSLDLDLHVETQVLVQRREGFVEQQHLRRSRGARQRDALLLAARQLSRITVAELRHVDSAEHFSTRGAMSSRFHFCARKPGDVLRELSVCGKSA